MHRTYYSIMLRLCLCLSVATLCSSVAIPTSSVAIPSSSYPVGDIRNCPITQLRDATKSVMLMDVLPGVGFDALRNLDAGQVYHHNFSSCEMSSDGLYLLPNDIKVTPILHSQVDFTAEVYDHYNEWTSETSHSLNAHAKVSWANINAKFSMDYQKTKSKVVNDKSRTTRIGLRHHLYSVGINPDSQLNPNFKSRVFEIAANIENNNKKLAHYLSELMIRDYGTHVVNSIDAGAILSQTTFFIDQTDTKKETSHLSISASASASFFSVFKINLKYSFDSTTSETDSFQKRSTSSYTTTHGGPPFKLGNNFTYADWEDNILDHLVVIDRRGEPLYSVLTPATIPELPSVITAQVSKYLYKATARYYKVNTHVGCTEYTSENFNFHANINDGSCKVAQQNYTFGGLYQTCENQDNEDVCTKENGRQKNPLTGDYSCPDGYTPVLLHSGTLKKDYTYSNRHCHSSWIFFKKCSTSTYVQLKSATYEAYWCALGPGEVRQNGLLFGGVYTATEANVITGQAACPEFYFPLHFGENMEVCVSSDVQASTGNLKFGGFHSCSAGNPMAATEVQFSKGVYPKLCPTHYSQLMMSVDEDCIINFCTDIRQVLDYQPQPPILPPFRRNFNLFSNSSNVLILTDTNGNTWVKQSNGEWVRAVEESSMTTGAQLLDLITTATVFTNSSNITTSNHMTSNSHQFSDGALAGVVIGTFMGTLSVVAFIWLTVNGIKRWYRNGTTKRGATADEVIPINTTHRVETTEN